MNVADGLLASARRLPDKVAVLAGGDRTTYGQLAERSGRAAAALQAQGLAPGDRVALILGNTVAYIEAFYGALRAGLVVVSVNTQLTEPELAHILTDCGARAVVAGADQRPLIEALRGSLPEVVGVLVAGGDQDLPVGMIGWEVALAAAGEPTPVDVAEGDFALLQYTSGTTGRPKGAQLTHANLVANHRQMEQTRLRVEEGDVVLSVLPLFHIYGLNVAMAFTLSRGATMLLIERFNPADTLAQVAEHRASILIGAPPMYQAWLATPDIATRDLASVRYAVSGAAPLPRVVLERFAEELHINIWEGYGLTETAPVLTSVAMAGEPTPGSVGAPVPGVELRLLDDAGNAVRPGDPGEVVVRGPNVFSGYWQQPEATREVLDADGWFRTGDVGYLDGGQLYLVDRKRDLIIVSGFNVYPREVEEVLVRHPKVAGAVVIGTPHPYTGECVKAVVVLRPGQTATAEEITEFCRTSLARFKIPEVVEFAEALPLLPSGKVKRRDLRDT